MALEGYERRIGRYGPSLARGFIAACGVAPPQRAIDVGCDTGALAAELVLTLGAGTVATADPDPVSVGICRERLPDADVRVAPAEELSFADASFDAALAQLVVAFMDEAEAGVREMRRVVNAAGVADVRTGEILAESEYADAIDLWEPMTVPDGAPGRYLAQVSANHADAIRRRMLAALEVPDEGPFTLSARAWHVTGRTRARPHPG